MIRKSTLLLCMMTAMLSLSASAQDVSLTKFDNGKQFPDVKKISQKQAATRADAEDPAYLADSNLVITTPKGTPTAYYMNNLIHDNSFGFVSNTRLKRYIYVDKDTVYVPMFFDALYKLEVENYMKGVLNEAGNEIVFNNKQPLFYSKNIKEVYYSCVLNSNGIAGDANTNAFDGGTFTMKIDKESGKISTDSKTIFGLYAGSDVTATYSLTANIAFSKVDESEKQFAYSNIYHNALTNTDDEKAAKVVIGDYVYIKGLNPKYPDTWFYGIATAADSIYVPSGQIAKLYNTLDNTICYFASGEDQTNLTYYKGAYLAIDKETSDLAFADTIKIANIGFDCEGNLRCYQLFSNVKLAAKHITLATPKAPTTLQYNNKRNALMVALSDVDTEYNKLYTDNLYYRFYINGEPYTFTKEAYSKYKLAEDMTLLPWSYDDYDIVSASGKNRYVYFLGLEDVKTIGVEEVYIVDGKAATSEIITYDVNTGKTTGIDSVSTDNNTSKVIGYYSLSGKRVNAPQHGVTIVKYADGTAKKIIKK